MQLQLQVEDLQAQLRERSDRTQTAVKAREEAESELTVSIERANKLASIVSQQEAVSAALRYELEAARELLGAREREMQALQEDRRDLALKLQACERDKELEIGRSIKLQTQLRDLEVEMDRILLTLDGAQGLHGVALGGEEAGPDESFMSEASHGMTTEELKERLTTMVQRLKK